MGFEPMTSLIPVQCSTLFSGVIFTTAKVVFIMARIVFMFTSLSAVHIYDFHVSTVI